MITKDDYAIGRKIESLRRECIEREREIYFLKPRECWVESSRVEWGNFLEIELNPHSTHSGKSVVSDSFEMREMMMRFALWNCFWTVKFYATTCQINSYSSSLKSLKTIWHDDDGCNYIFRSISFLKVWSTLHLSVEQKTSNELKCYLKELVTSPIFILKYFCFYLQNMR